MTTKQKNIAIWGGAIGAVIIVIAVSEYYSNKNKTTTTVAGADGTTTGTTSGLLKWNGLLATSQIPGFADNGAHDRQMWYNTNTGILAHAG